MDRKKSYLLLASSLLILTGVFLIILSLTDINRQEQATEQSLTEAKEKVEFTREQPANPVIQEEQLTDFSFKKGEAIGILEIPRLDAELPIIEGTDEDELEKGVGHYSSTALPGQPDQILLSGHRDTVFRRLGELEIGDIFYISMPYGSYSYEITHTQIVDANDTTVIQTTAPIETLTVSTCYPFSFIGDAPDRYVMTALRINTTIPK